MREDERERFDAMVDAVIDSLPKRLHALLEEAPLVVEDRPSPQMLRELGMEDQDVLAGLHTGRALTERSVEDSAGLPDVIHLFREGIIEMAGGWRTRESEARIREEIRITVLHEIGHHFGLDEDDLEELGYD